MFLDPVAQFAKQLNRTNNGEYFVWRPHLNVMTFFWPLPSPPMWVETYSVFWNEKLTMQELTKI